MGYSHLIPFALSLALNLPAFGKAKPVSCEQSSPKDSMFARYQELSDETIKKDCTYLGPTDLTAKEEQNRHLNCVRGLTKMRDISRRYLSEKQIYCQAIAAKVPCEDTSAQSACMVEAGKIAAGAQRSHDALAALLEEGTKQLKITYQTYQRLQQNPYKRDFEALQKMPPHLKLGNSIPMPGKGTVLPPEVRRAPNLFPPPQTNPAPPDPPMAEQPQPEPAAPESSPRQSGITSSEGGSSSGPDYIRAETGGATTLAEYERRLPFILEQQERDLEKMREFERSAKVKQSEHRVTATDLAMKTASLFLAAEKLGAVDPEIKEWKAENKKVVQQYLRQEKTAQLPSGKESEMKKTKLQAEEITTPSPNSAALAVSEEAGRASAPEAQEKDADESVLDSFKTSLSSDPIAKEPEYKKRLRLRELLRKQMQAQLESLQAGAEESELAASNSADIVNDVISEAENAGGPESGERAHRGLSSQDLDGELSELEKELRAQEDLKSGILAAQSQDLFSRVRAKLKSFDRERRSD